VGSKRKKCSADLGVVPASCLNPGIKGKLVGAKEKYF